MRERPSSARGAAATAAGPLLLLLLLLALLLAAVTTATAEAALESLGGVTSVKALRDVMYRDMKGWGGAYRLLNATGAVGSQGDQNELLYIDAPLVHYSHLASGRQDRGVVVLLPVADSVAFFKQLLAEPTLQQRVKGILVDDTELPTAYSSLGPFPGAEYAPYQQRGHVWNAAAATSGGAFPSALTWLPAPTFLLTAQMAADAAARATYNALGSPAQQQYHARLKLTMTAGAAPNSSECLAAGTCKPLGGYSVWCALPALPALPAAPPPPAGAGPDGDDGGAAGDDGGAVSGGGDGGDDDGRPIILVAAQMDGIDMFHDAVEAADSQLSGLVAMLAALHLLKAATAAGYAKRLVFVALAGEPWGYMGSRRLLFEAESGSNATAGLQLERVEQVIEVSQVGRLAAQPPGRGGGGGEAAPVTLFAHSQKGPGYGNASALVAALSDAAAQEASAAKVTLQEASASNPGIPPSSLMSFLRVNASIQGVVLAEFDQGFTNPYYGSRFDNGSRVDAGSIARAAAVLAAGLHRLAGGDPRQMQLNMTALVEVVGGLLSCVAMPVPGFACPQAAAVMSADYVYSQADGTRSYTPKNYVGVLQYLPDAQGPLGKGNLARFVWNLMAAAAASGGPGREACDPFDKPCPAGQVCAGWRASGKDPAYLGRCLAATVRYVPAYATSLSCAACDAPWQANWQLTDAADAWHRRHGWPPDPVWTESDWPLGVPDLQLYLHEAPTVERAVLAAGAVATAAVGAASYAARVAFARHHAAWLS